MQEKDGKVWVAIRNIHTLTLSKFISRSASLPQFGHRAHRECVQFEYDRARTYNCLCNSRCPTLQVWIRTSLYAQFFVMSFFSSLSFTFSVFRLHPFGLSAFHSGTSSVSLPTSVLLTHIEVLASVFVPAVFSIHVVRAWSGVNESESTILDQVCHPPVFITCDVMIPPNTQPVP